MNDYRILVVDDEKKTYVKSKFNLKTKLQVDTANSAEEALKLDIGAYSLLLLDVMMGEISWFQNGKHDQEKKNSPYSYYIYL